jgi:hypothetical protein
MVTRQALPSITRQRGTTTGSANLMLYGAGKTTVSNNTTFIDSSANNFTVTRNGDTVQSGFNPFSQASSGAGVFDGTGDYLTVPAGSAFAYGTGDFTIELWFYSTAALPAYGANLFAQTVFGTNYLVFKLGSDSPTPTNVISFTATSSGGGTAISSSTTFTQNTWNHCAVCRVSGVVTVYLNGVGGTPTSNTTNLTNTTYVPTIGRYTHEASQHFTGYISNLRIVNGTAVYTSNFTPPTSPLTAITNTSLLLLTNNYSIVNSTSTNLPVTINGNTTISTAQFPTGMSSSMYFDGNGDYLSIPYNTAFDFSTGDWTVELWWYPTTTGVDQNLIMVNFSGSDGYAHARIAATTTNKFYILSSSNGVGWLNITQFGSWTTGQWYHLAFVRYGSAFTLYVNGVSAGSYSYSGSLTNFSGVTQVGRVNTVSGTTLQYTYGYISNVRVCKGTALYTANFTPPSLPMSTTVTVPNFVTNNIYGLNQIP